MGEHGIRVDVVFHVGEDGSDGIGNPHGDLLLLSPPGDLLHPLFGRFTPQ